MKLSLHLLLSCFCTSITAYCPRGAYERYILPTTLRSLSVANPDGNNDSVYYFYGYLPEGLLVDSKADRNIAHDCMPSDKPKDRCNIIELLNYIWAPPKNGGTGTRTKLDDPKIKKALARADTLDKVLPLNLVQFQSAVMNTPYTGGSESKLVHKNAENYYDALEKIDKAIKDVLIITTGARFDARDTKGRMLLHTVVFSWEADERAPAYLVTELGMDPQEVDYEGNSLYHHAPTAKYRGSFCKPEPGHRST